jgi:glycosyltransferase involved in cell wall biosynthesis
MITACYILRDAEKSIISSLNSLLEYNFIKQIVCVVDTRTTDRTMDVLRQWADTNNHIKVIITQYAWETDSFADARNKSISLATEPFWMIIDADEILEQLCMPDLSCDFYIGTIINTYPNAGDIAYYSVRLCKNDIGIKYEWARHENVERSLQGKVQGTMSLVVRHNGYDEMTEEQKQDKSRSLLERHLKQLIEEPDNIALYYYLFNCYRDLKDYNNAVKYGIEALFAEILPGLKAQVCIGFYHMYKHQGLNKLAINMLLRSLDFCSDQYTAYGILYAEKPNLKTKIISEVSGIEASALPYDITKTKLMELLNNE